MRCHVTDLVSEQLHAPGDVSNKDEILNGHCSMDVDLCIDEGHTHQILVVLEVPHEYLRRERERVQQFCQFQDACVHQFWALCTWLSFVTAL